MSATTTLAPSRANASAVSRPIPFAAPVTNATFPANFPDWFAVIARFLSCRSPFGNGWVMRLHNSPAIRVRLSPQLCLFTELYEGLRTTWYDEFPRCLYDLPKRGDGLRRDARRFL